MIRRAVLARKKPELPEWDDGRTISDMNVDGMPWYSPKKKDPAGERKDSSSSKETLTKEESRYYTWGALKAALLVVGVICAGLVLFVLFCQYVWFR